MDTEVGGGGMFSERMWIHDGGGEVEVEVEGRPI